MLWMAQKKLPPAVLEFFRKHGKQGGLIGGKKSMETMTAAERSARAKKAVQAREAKKQERKKVGE